MFPSDYKQLRCIVYNTRDVNWQEKLSDNIKKTIGALFNARTTTDHLRWPYDTSLLKVTGQTGPFVLQAMRANRFLDPLNRGVNHSQKHTECMVRVFLGTRSLVETDPIVAVLQLHRP